MSVKQGFALFLMIWNLVVFLVYGLDKGKARKGSYRISEKTLLMMTYVGGGLGAWAGGTHFRHKTQKKYFQLAWAVGVLIDALLIYWMWK
ncbi:TPA: DUF1294 domain-containing protein [Streptococcus suis]|jgi:uncharacterized membrane protein YsdA (DUF1294 family)|uniref:DUF1294 domain-containing protein n=1 Tax=Streptococcus parasuis TaxID=1501662 RepID=UPI002378D3B6|nr:DUF1294 domain-containing protein [Streptococcus parasuis]MDG4499028.1 DUF1294 domain-containing protein [Streptococcus suis]WDN58126.1 DUF1294 domain-containing protein [Streptococcus parasuis]WDN59942.1 DUF1294 domain-containing protein [Streptococcus parasuis]HEM3597784.1 DUF1294 domain-containing protein [Streptococcus suis]HEM3607790.1 DUF1294 domain-containing protein [Streptococcus suis]